MKKRLMIFVAAVMLLITALPLSASAAVSGNPGKKVTVTFTFNDSYGFNGKIKYSNPSIFSEYAITAPSEEYVTSNSVYFYQTKKATRTLVISATISANAKVGDSCVITFEDGYNIIDENGTPTPVSKTETVTVTAAPTESKPSGGSSGTTSSTPSKPSSKVDYTELNRQITIANDLKKDGYTDDSWNAMRSALTAARNLRSSSSQSAVDAGAKKLADAIAALTKVDYTKLQEAIDAGKKYSDSTGLTDLWNKYFAAFDKANQMLSSGNQAGIDKAAEELNAALAELKAKMDEYGAKEVIKEVEVEVDPTGPFCNIRVHKLWLILLIISAVLNVAFIVLFVLWYLNRKKNYKDDTPLVSYDIADDD